MIKKFFVTLIACSAFLVSCNNDDDNVDNMPIESRNSLDDKAIEQFLNDYYFSPKNGKLTKFDDKDDSDNNYPSLKTLAKYDPAGYWYAQNPNHVGTGETITSNDSTKVYLSYEMTTFKSTDDLSGENNSSKKYYGSMDIGNNGATFNTADGSALADPNFYYFMPTETEAKNGVTRVNRELKYFTEGLKHFKTTDRAISDLYNFQGVIILPSRSAYARNKYYVSSTYGLSDLTYRDVSFIFNIELPKIEKRTK
ncbi:hypothetical protein [Algoriella sp.]|uniref:hypothetical protein n=1 Tax=Algoriella sp. TaxID=1872434 RepID=UPI001B108224|nr:hypothetical protein [Algoriella sp.]MBO6212291.1 hypothetical protein [Algoriella sp.]